MPSLQNILDLVLSEGLLSLVLFWTWKLVEDGDDDMRHLLDELPAFAFRSRLMIKPEWLVYFKGRRMALNQETANEEQNPECAELVLSDNIVDLVVMGDDLRELTYGLRSSLTEDVQCIVDDIVTDTDIPDPLNKLRLAIIIILYDTVVQEKENLYNFITTALKKHSSGLLPTEKECGGMYCTESPVSWLGICTRLYNCIKLLLDDCWVTPPFRSVLRDLLMASKSRDMSLCEMEYYQRLLPASDSVEKKRLIWKQQTLEKTIQRAEETIKTSLEKIRTTTENYSFADLFW